ncbi:hypothetical protein QLX08_001766 [Tetragonisca angustula]|uniref:Uncharacterized protein n=1 Tax=Tetragonisca angustula TaxID=166442 RepID=A0AAW1ADN4_9HYME
MKGLKTARPRFGAGEREKGKPAEAEEAAAATERWKRSLEDGPRPSLVHARVGEASRGGGEARENRRRKNESRDGGDGWWMGGIRKRGGTKSRRLRVPGKPLNGS